MNSSGLVLLIDILIYTGAIAVLLVGSVALYRFIKSIVRHRRSKS